MRITYKNKELEDMCENPNERELNKKYGVEFTKNFKRRILQIKSYDNLSLIPTTPPFRRHKLTDSKNYKDCYAISITNQYRLIFKSTIENKNIIEIQEILITEVSKHYEK